MEGGVAAVAVCPLKRVTTHAARSEAGSLDRADKMNVQTDGGTGMSAKRAPPMVAWLGYGGLLPFIALMAASFLDPPRSGAWQQGLLNYGAVILAFVGALHWGFAMGSVQMDDGARGVSFAWSVAPALLAWLALLLDPFAGSALLAAGFAAHYVQDRRLVRHASLPSWYLPLRLRLTVVAALCLLLGSFASRG